MYVWVKGFGNPAVNYYNQLYVCNNDDSNFVRGNHFFFSDRQPVQHITWSGEPYLQCYETSYNNKLHTIKEIGNIQGLFYSTHPLYQNYLWCKVGSIFDTATFISHPYGAWNIRNDGSGGISQDDSPSSTEFDSNLVWQGYNLVKV